MVCRKIIVACGIIAAAPFCRAAEDLPAPANDRSAASSWAAKQIVSQSNQKQKPSGYGSHAIAKPLPVNPYAGYGGLSTAQLADAPAAYENTQPIRRSVPLPVLPDQVNNFPATPPFVSPAFAPSTTPQPGMIASQPKR